MTTNDMMETYDPLSDVLAIARHDPERAIRTARLHDHFRCGDHLTADEWRALIALIWKQAGKPAPAA